MVRGRLGGSHYIPSDANLGQIVLVGAWVGYWIVAWFAVAVLFENLVYRLGYLEVVYRKRDNRIVTQPRHEPGCVAALTQLFGSLAALTTVHYYDVPLWVVVVFAPLIAPLIGGAIGFAYLLLFEKRTRI